LLNNTNNATKHFVFFFIVDFIGFGAIVEGTFFIIPEIRRVPLVGFLGFLEVTVLQMQA